MATGKWLPTLAAVAVIGALATGCDPTGSPESQPPASARPSTTSAGPASSSTLEPGMPDVAHISVDDMCGLLDDDEVRELLAEGGIRVRGAVDRVPQFGSGPRCDFRVGDHEITVDIWTTEVTRREFNTRIAGERAFVPERPTPYCMVHIRIADTYDLQTVFGAAGDGCPVAKKAAQLVWPRLPR